MKNIFKRIILWIRNIILILFVLSLFFVLLYKYVPVYYTSSMFFDSIERIREKDSPTKKHKWIPLEDISQHAIQAVIASEDNLFFVHNGFFFEIPDGTQAEFPTISQQTARMVFLWSKRSWLRKAMETYYTVLIEFVWGKERILEVYLNSVETGDRIFGVEAIAEKAFGKNAGELTIEEAALIAIAISDPKGSDVNAPSSYMLKRQAKIISQMEKMIPVGLGKIQENHETEK